MKEVLENQGRVVYFGSESIAKHYKNKFGLESSGGRKLYFGKKKFMPWFNALYYKSPRYFSEHLNRAILLMRDMDIQTLISVLDEMPGRIEGELKKAHLPTDYGLIKLEHLFTAGKIIGGICAVSIISLAFEFIYEYAKEKFAVLSE